MRRVDIRGEVQTVFVAKMKEAREAREGISSIKSFAGRDASHAAVANKRK